MASRCEAIGDTSDDVSGADAGHAEFWGQRMPSRDSQSPAPHYPDHDAVINS